MPDVFWASQAYERSDHGLPAEMCVNMFPEAGAAAGSDEPYALIPREGRVQFADTTENFCDGGFQKDGVVGGAVLTVHEGRVWSTDKFGASTNIGAIDLPLGPVRFAAIRNAVAILGQSGNVFRTDGTIVAEITDADLPDGIQDITAIDQRIVYGVKGQDQFYWSEILQADDIVGLSFATAEREADDIIALHRSHQLLWIMGTETCEAWQGTGSVSEAAFTPVPGATMERGCVARNSVLNADNSLWFLGDNAIFYRVGSGYVPERRSTHAIEERAAAEIAKGNAAKIRSWTYTRGGHEHIGLYLPTEGTFVYDVASGRWWEGRTGQEATYRKVFAIQAFNKILVGEDNSGVISELTPTVFEDNGSLIERVATANTPVKSKTPAFAFRVNCVEGQGLQTGQGSSPLVMLDYSDDGEGKVWSKERRLGIGRVGKYAKRVIARMLGQMQPPGRIWRVRITDPVNFTLRKATLNEIDP